MNKTTRASVALIICAGLSGCLSAGGDDGEDEPRARSYEDQEAIATQLATDIAPLSPTEPSSLPTMGSVDYSGTVSIAANADTTVLLGDFAITADFETSAVSGTLSNVNEAGGADYRGTIPLTDGSIDRSAAVAQTVQGDLIGDVVDGDGNTLSFDTSISGDFFDDEGYIAGDVIGNLTIGGVQTPIETNKGAFAVQAEP